MNEIVKETEQEKIDRETAIAEEHEHWVAVFAEELIVHNNK